MIANASRLTSPGQAITAELLNESASIAIGELANRLAMSPSMVRHRLPEVRRWVECAGGELVTVGSGRLELAIESDARNQARAILAHSDLVLTGSERRTLILASLALATGDIQADYLAAMFSVSRSTLFADLRELRVSLSAGITLQGSPGKGIALHADEISRRRLLVRTLDSVIGDDWPWRLTTEPRLAVLPELMDSNANESAQAAMSSLDSAGVLTGAQDAGSGLVGYVVIAMARRVDSPIPAGLTPVTEIPAEALRAATRVWTDLCGGSPDAAETAELARHISVARSLLTPRIKKLLPKVSAQLIELVRDMLSDEIASLPAFRLALDEHLRSSIPRLIHGIGIDLPNPAALRLAYPHADLLARRAVEAIGMTLGARPLASETTSFLMLLAAFSERIVGQPRQTTRAVIVCNTGTATALLLRERIVREMPQIEVVSVLSHAALSRSPDVVGDVDLILTTAQLTQPYPIPVICVSPLLPPHDIKAIERMTVRRLGRSSAGPRSQRISMDDFTASFDRDACSIGAHADDWKDAMRQAGSLLVAAGAVADSYVEATIDSVIRYGPYIVMAPGVALPHANNDGNVFRTCFGLLTLTEPVEFVGTESTEMIDILIPMAAADGKDHVGILAGLARSLQDNDFVTDIRSARDSDEALAVLKKQLTGGIA